MMVSQVNGTRIILYLIHQRRDLDQVTNQYMLVVHFFGTPRYRHVLLSLCVKQTISYFPLI